MNGTKRYISQKGAPGKSGKSRDLPSTSTNSRDSIESDSVATVLLKQCENVKLLPKYTAILGRSGDDGVNMDDLNQLQIDLEKLFSNCGVRNRLLRKEIDVMENDEYKDNASGNGNLLNNNSGNNRRGKASLKRKRTDDNVQKFGKYNTKDVRNTTITTNNQINDTISNKRQYTTPSMVNNLLGDLRADLPKINLPKNDTSDKFWASVEPFCATINNSHALFLDKLIEECSQEIDLKIPELGDYYANDWNESATNMENDLGGLGKMTSSNAKKNGLNTITDTFPNSKTQRLLSALIEERVLTTFPNITTKLKSSDLSVLKSCSGGPRAAICMDRILEKNLLEQGILTLDDLPKTYNNEMDDEILQEIKKCQQELLTINEYNVDELNRLKLIVIKDIKRQELKGNLDKIDQQLLDIYNKILIIKQKQLKDDELLYCNKTMKEYEMQTDNLLKQQIKIQKEIDDLQI